MDRFPQLYRIVRKRNATVNHVLSSRPLKVSFRQGLVGNNLTNWLRLVSEVASVRLNESEDMFVWSLNKNGTFSVQCLYKESMNREGPCCRSSFWKLKLQLKIKVFLWYLKKGVV